MKRAKKQHRRDRGRAQDKPSGISRYARKVIEGRTTYSRMKPQHVLPNKG